MQNPISRLFSLLILLLFSTLALSAQIPEKSPNDDNQYRFIELDNGLKVILVSDEDADKAAASMNVAVGSGDDPAEREGLSHFLEHMLFLGTEKYPDPGEYQQFIKSHGGQHNAFTAFQDTNYFFDVQAEFLEPALDRFAQQFSAPLFTAELVDRERNAVHSEFSAKQKDDGRRFYSVKKAVSNPDHAFSHFAVGNLSTLENTEANPLIFTTQQWGVDIGRADSLETKSVKSLQPDIHPVHTCGFGQSRMLQVDTLRTGV